MVTFFNLISSKYASFVACLHWPFLAPWHIPKATFCKQCSARQRLFIIVVLRAHSLLYYVLFMFEKYSFMLHINAYMKAMRHSVNFPVLYQGLGKTKLYVYRNSSCTRFSSIVCQYTPNLRCTDQVKYSNYYLSRSLLLCTFYLCNGCFVYFSVCCQKTKIIFHVWY